MKERKKERKKSEVRRIVGVRRDYKRKEGIKKEKGRQGRR